MKWRCQYAVAPEGELTLTFSAADMLVSMTSMDMVLGVVLHPRLLGCRPLDSVLPDKSEDSLDMW